MGEVDDVPEILKISESFGSFYGKFRPLAVISKFLGALPLENTLKDDGRELRHRWISLIHLWDVIICSAIIIFFMKSCSELLLQSEYGEDQNGLAIWLTLTCYIVAVRGAIQFVLLHIYTSRFPELFAALEEYHQVKGASLIKSSPNSWLFRLMPVVRTFAVLIIMETTSFFFFDQLNGDSIFLAAWPVATSFMFANLWRELPMNMFMFICKYLIDRFLEIRAGVQAVREKGGKDTAKELETLRLQHAALSRILSLVQVCYGFQLAVNLLFLLMDTVLQLYVFFVITSSRNGILLVLALYFFLMSWALVFVVERLERTDDGLLQEIAAFKLCSASRDHQLQVQLFTIQLTARPVKISAAGFFFINNAVICALLGAVATYIVMLVQFTPYIELHLANITLPSIW